MTQALRKSMLGLERTFNTEAAFGETRIKDSFVELTLTYDSETWTLNTFALPYMLMVQSAEIHTLLEEM